MNRSHLRALITGANRGLGFETARQLLHKGCDVILSARRSKDAELARSKLLQYKIYVDQRIDTATIDLEHPKTFHSTFDALVEQQGIDNPNGLLLTAFWVHKQLLLERRGNKMRKN